MMVDLKDWHSFQCLQVEVVAAASPHVLGHMYGFDCISRPTTPCRTQVHYAEVAEG